MLLFINTGCHHSQKPLTSIVMEGIPDKLCPILGGPPPTIRSPTPVARMPTAGAGTLCSVSPDVLLLVGGAKVLAVLLLASGGEGVLAVLRLVGWARV